MYLIIGMNLKPSQSVACFAFTTVIRQLLVASRGLGSIQHAHILQHVHTSCRPLACTVHGQQGAVHAAPQGPTAPFTG